MREDKAEGAFCFVFSFKAYNKRYLPCSGALAAGAGSIGKSMTGDNGYGLGEGEEGTYKKILAGSICRIPGGNICPCRDLVCLADQWKNGQRRLRVRGNI